MAELPPPPEPVGRLRRLLTKAVHPYGKQTGGLGLLKWDLKRGLVGGASKRRMHEFYRLMAIGQPVETAMRRSGVTAKDLNDAVPPTTNRATEKPTASPRSRIVFLRSQLAPGEIELAHAGGWERTPRGEAEIVILVSNRRVLWTYEKGRREVVLDISFKDVVAFLGSEGESGLILEAAEARYEEISPGETTLALFRLKDSGSAHEIIGLVETNIPPAARETLPDIH